MQRCFPSYLSLFVSSVAECKSGLSVEARARYAPGAVFDKAAFDASTSCFQTLPCDELHGHEIETLCSQPKPSNAAPLGAECNKPNDCASAFCDGKTDAACGHCAASVVGKIGDACNYVAGRLCPAGAFCNGTCIAVREIGDACNGTMTCGNALKCVSGKCAMPGALGATCSDASQCDVFQLLTCDKVAGQCAAIVFLGAGTACDTSESASPCANGLHCIAPAGSSSGTCQVGVQPSMACTRSSDCTLGYHCSGSICKAAGAGLPSASKADATAAAISSPGGVSDTPRRAAVASSMGCPPRHLFTEERARIVLEAVDVVEHDVHENVAPRVCRDEGRDEAHGRALPPRRVHEDQPGIAAEPFL